MKAKPVSPHFQRSFLYPNLIDQLDPKDPLLLLAEQIPWEQLENYFAPLCAERGRPAKPIRLMVGLLILKQLENLSDERIVVEWKRNPYFQAFCGMKTFHSELPCEPSDLCHFRKRPGEAGFEKIFKISVLLHGKDALENEIIVDTTVQEKNITYPTDTNNEYDGSTLPSLLCQVGGNQGKRPAVAYCDRGFRGKKEIEETRIEIPENAPKEKTEHYKRKAREKFRHRSAIEGINSHLKFDFRMLRNYLKGIIGDTINLLMAAAAFNFKKWMRATALNFLSCFLPRFLDQDMNPTVAKGLRKSA